MAKDKKSKMVSMRITEEQYEMLERLGQEIRNQTGFHITRASIMLKLMEYGLPHLRRELEKKAS